MEAHNPSMSDQIMTREELGELLSYYAGEHSSYMDRAWCRKRVLETYDALHTELAHWREAARSVGEVDGHGWATTTEHLREELAQVRQTLQSIAETGVTEALLRAHDGFIKIGKGCVVVRDDEYLAMRAKLEEKP